MHRRGRDLNEIDIGHGSNQTDAVPIDTTTKRNNHRRSGRTTSSINGIKELLGPVIVIPLVGLTRFVRKQQTILLVERIEHVLTISERITGLTARYNGSVALGVLDGEDVRQASQRIRVLTIVRQHGELQPSNLERNVHHTIGIVCHLAANVHRLPCTHGFLEGPAGERAKYSVYGELAHARTVEAIQIKGASSGGETHQIAILAPPRDQSHLYTAEGEHTDEGSVGIHGHVFPSDKDEQTGAVSLLQKGLARRLEDGIVLLHRRGRGFARRSTEAVKV
mmetsp:Transcript_25446/g.39403  ORF Transcript_25446/g.39403 Transcript_25446/m.39403 type:complete len:279 (-) Transcript_25446:215-1051(-)